MLTHSSPELTSTTWSPVTARPDVGADVADARGPTRSSRLARRDDPRHLRLRCAGRGVAVRRAGCGPGTTGSARPLIERDQAAMPTRRRPPTAPARTPARPGDHARERAAVAARRRGRDGAAGRGPRQQQRAQRRGDGERDHHRGDDGERVGAHEGREERARHAASTKSDGHRGEQQRSASRRRWGRASRRAHRRPAGSAAAASVLALGGARAGAGRCSRRRRPRRRRPRRAPRPGPRRPSR